MTATQVMEMATERMILVGLLIERSEDELLDPIHHRTLGIGLMRGLLPPPPQELLQSGYNIKYISPLSLARLNAGAQAIEECLVRDRTGGRLRPVQQQAAQTLTLPVAADQFAHIFAGIAISARGDLPVDPVAQLVGKGNIHRAHGAIMGVLAIFGKIA